jgi:hypothetical protein
MKKHKHTLKYCGPQFSYVDLYTKLKPISLERMGLDIPRSNLMAKRHAKSSKHLSGHLNDRKSKEDVRIDLYHRVITTH